MSVRHDLEQMEQDVKDLYKNLCALPSQTDAFYSVDQVGADGFTYRIFLYRLASYSDWLYPGALESRGIMFRIEEDGSTTLVSRPMEKFFNWKEMSTDVNALAQALILQGRLSQDVWDRAKTTDSNTHS